MTFHTEDHPLKGKTVVLNDKTQDPKRGMVVPGAKLEIENWVDRMDLPYEPQQSWQTMRSNFSAMHYAMRAGFSTPVLPVDDEVVYGHIGGLGHMVHVSELGDEVPDE